MAAIAFNASAFYAAFPAFQGTIPEESLAQYWITAGLYISNPTWGCRNTAKTTQYLNLMTAHLAAISQLIMSGTTPGLITQSTIDKVSVTLQPPPLKTQFQYWLNLTPYGQQLLALLQVNSVGGQYIGGRPVRAGFRC